MLRQNLATVVVEIELRAASSVMLSPEMAAGSASAALAIRCSLGRKPGRHCRNRTRMSSVIGPDPLFSKVTTLAPPALAAGARQPSARRVKNIHQLNIRGNKLPLHGRYQGLGVAAAAGTPPVYLEDS